MERSESGFPKSVAREFAVLAVAAIGAYLFFIHDALYGPGGSAGHPLTLEGFLLVTSVLYLFLRLVFVVAGFYYPTAKPAAGICEECGRALDETTPGAPTGRPATRHSRRPTEKEVLAAVMLRKAIDDARRSSKRDLAGPRPEQVRVPGDVENLPVPPEEFDRILRQLDSPRGSRSPEDRRPRGPA